MGELETDMKRPTQELCGSFRSGSRIDVLPEDQLSK